MTTTTALLRDLDGIQAPAPGTWTIDASHSEVAFSARHMMVSKVKGRFPRFSGQLEIAERPEDSSLRVEIEAAGIDTGNEQRDAHLRSADFLDVERFPTLRYTSRSVEQTGRTTLRVEGELTIRDVTRPVTLFAEYEGGATPPWGGTVAGFTARAEIDREDFGIVWNQVLEAGGVLVSKKIQIEIEIEAVLGA